MQLGGGFDHKRQAKAQLMLSDEERASSSASGGSYQSLTANNVLWGSLRWKTKSSSARWSRCSMRSTREISSGSRTDSGLGLQFLQHGRRPRLAHSPSSQRRSSVHFGLDPEQLADAHQSLVRKCPGLALLLDVDVPQFSASVAPASSFEDPTVLVDGVVPGVGIGLQNTAEVLQVPRRVLALAIGRVLEPHRRRRLVTAGAVITHVDPEPSLVRLLALASVWVLRQKIMPHGSTAGVAVITRRFHPPSGAWPCR
jgi:hypothetical protein